MERTNYTRKNTRNVVRWREGNVVICFVLALFVLASLCSAMGNPEVAAKAMKPVAVNAKTVTWYSNYNFPGGLGTWQTRTKHIVKPDSKTKSTKVKYEDMHVVLEYINKSSKSQKAIYSESKTDGATYNAEVSAEVGHFKAALGVTLTKSKTVTCSAWITVPAKTTCKVSCGKRRIFYQKSDYTKQPQRYTPLKDWYNTGTAKKSKPLVKKYQGRAVRVE